MSKNKKGTIIVIVIGIIVIALKYYSVFGIQYIKYKRYADVSKIKYEVEKVSNTEYNIYFTDGKYYYKSDEEDMIGEESCIMILKVCSQTKVSGYTFNPLKENFSEICIFDLKGNILTVWERNAKKR